MNKVMKTAGLATVLCAAMSVNTIISRFNNNSLNEKDQKELLQKNNIKDDGMLDPALWLSLTGLGIAGFAGANIRKHKFQKENLYGEIQQLIPESYELTSKKSKKTKHEKEVILNNNFYELVGLMRKSKITDKAAFALFEFTYKALMHAVKYDYMPEKDLGIKLEYLAFKSITPLKQAEKLKEQYEEKYPAVNFNEAYGQITYIKRGHYAPVSNRLVLYEGLQYDTIMYRINEIEKEVKKTKNHNLFYRHDREVLLQKISELRTKLINNQNYNPNLLTEISGIYHTKRLSKVIEV